MALRHRDYIYFYEEGLAKKVSPEETNRIRGLYNQAFPRLARIARGKGKGLLPGFPAVHTVIIPAVFIVFWATVLVFWIITSGLDKPQAFGAAAPGLVIVLLAILGCCYPTLEPEADSGPFPIVHTTAQTTSPPTNSANKA